VGHTSGASPDAVAEWKREQQGQEICSAAARLASKLQLRWRAAEQVRSDSIVAETGHPVQWKKVM